MSHLRRAARLLVALVLVVVAARWVLSSDLLPHFAANLGAVQVSNAQLGRPTADNVQEWADRPAQYQGSQRCADCHQTIYADWAAHKAAVACETCHGAGRAHLDDGSVMAVDRSRDFCSTCHAQLPSRPAAFPQVVTADHNPGVACVQCHSPHGTQIKKPPAIPHSLEGRGDCLACHGKFAPLPENHAGRESMTCQSCHKPGGTQ